MTLYVVDILKGKREPDSAVFDSSTALEQVGVVGTPADGSRRYVRVFEVLECLTDDTCPTT